MFLRSLLSQVLAIAIGLLLLSTTVLSQPLSERLRLRQREIVDVRFDSNFSISSAELQSVIATRPSSDVSFFPGFFNSFLGLKTEIVDESVQGYDTLVLQSYYKNNGFLQSRVYFTLHENPKSSEEWQKVFDQNKLLPIEKRKPYPLVADTVVFHVKEGKPYTINLFTFEGTEHLSPDLLDKVTKNISIKRGSKYTRKDLAAEVKRVQDILTENGYAFFSVPRNWATIEMDTIHKSVNVSVVFNIGPRIKNGKVTIIYDTAFTNRGQVRLTTIHDRVALDSGQWFRASDLRATEDELFRLGTFEIVRIDLDTTKYANKLDSIPEGNAVPITIFLRMRSPLELT
ncbi:MAG TPA: POTRA domain-containing protein, partial [Candidatus Kapabacteria bacterium]|nr:POTRA domain-containing protein [Candidatus Kapabacteria bacterium]